MSPPSRRDHHHQRSSPCIYVNILTTTHPKPERKTKNKGKVMDAAERDVFQGRKQREQPRPLRLTSTHVLAHPSRSPRASPHPPTHSLVIYARFAQKPASVAPKKRCGGKKGVAFFDLDHTIIDTNSSW